MLNRRKLIQYASVTGVATALTSATVSEARDSATAIRIVDTNVNLSRWPFRRLPLDETDRLLAKMRELGVNEAWASSYDGILHRDISAVNLRLANACLPHPELRPVGAINPTLPGWREDLQRCIDEHKMRVLRVHPGYHKFTLEDERFAQLLKQAAAKNCLVQVATALEDVRTQHSSLRVADVDLSPLPRLMSNMHGARVQLLNYRPRLPLPKALAEAPGVFFDTSRVESTDGVAKLVEQAPQRALFGSHAPFLIPEAALIRVHESDLLKDNALRAVLAGNADRLWSEITA